MTRWVVLGLCLCLIGGPISGMEEGESLDLALSELIENEWERNDGDLWKAEKWWAPSKIPLDTLTRVKIAAPKSIEFSEVSLVTTPEGENEISLLESTWGETFHFERIQYSKGQKRCENGTPYIRVPWNCGIAEMDQYTCFLWVFFVDRDEVEMELCFKPDLEPETQDRLERAQCLEYVPIPKRQRGTRLLPFR